MLRYITCLLFIIVTVQSVAQVNLDKAVDFPNTRILQGMIIKKIIEGPFGFIWIASDEGLFRFDGSMLELIIEGDFEDIDIDEINHQFVFTSRENLILQSYPEERR